MTRSAHILLVDDEPSIQKGLTPLPASRGYEVESATTGRAALEAFQQSAPDHHRLRPPSRRQRRPGDPVDAEGIRSPRLPGPSSEPGADRHTILTAIWGPHAAAQPEYLWVPVGQLRKRLEPDPSHPRYLVSEPWVGYRFVVDTD